MLEPISGDFRHVIKQPSRNTTVSHKQKIKPTATKAIVESKKVASEKKRNLTLEEMILADREYIRQGGRRYFTDNADDMRDYFGTN